MIGNAEVWGSDLYVSDSPVCIAAIHAGVLQVDQPGLVTILVSAGADAFTGSTRNGVTTKSYGPNATSYSFDRTGAPGQIDWSTKGMGIPETFTSSFPVTCPGSGAMTFQIWGSDVYHEESSICIAAVHAGLITRATGGNILVQGDNGKYTYPAVDRNGVLSTAWSGGALSFKVSASTKYTIAVSPSPDGAGATPPPSTPTNSVCSPGQTSPGPAPTWVKANVSSTTATPLTSPVGADLTWSAVPGAAGYVIERSPSNKMPAKIASTCDTPDAFKADANQVAFLDRTGGIHPEMRFIYIVRAFGSAGQMGWNSTSWTAPTPPTPTVQVQPSGSTVTLHWGLSEVDPLTGQHLTAPDKFAVTSEYGYSVVLSGGTFSHSILGVPLGAHTFTVEARWSPDVKTSASQPVSIVP